MGVRNFMTSAKRLFQVAQKPNWEEVTLLIKVTAIGVLIIGGLGFVIRVLFWLVGLYQLAPSQAST